MPRKLDPIEAFSEALDLRAEARPAFLDRLRRTDASTADEVVALLASREKLGDFLEPSGTRPTLSALFADPQDQLGRMIGAYRLKSVLGIGGMSVVYAAERADDRFSKTVAIKLVRASSGEELIRRIERERRLLAQLEHPNIARLLDSGEAEDGSPFIVMEWVDGPPIDSYCDEARLNVEARLRLFTTVCSAVEYARTQGIIHRDLKPSNVLVAADGTVKLLDFGIAKAMEAAGLGSAGELTATATTLLSPLYASPEQIADARITPATDVYALGILLHELLSGVHPYGASKSVAEVLDAVRRSDPSPPSLAVLSAPGSALAARRATAGVLSRRLRGDLDNIVRRAIHRDASRRYGTAGHLSADIERHLSARPVLARPDTIRYRLSKWILRNRIPAAAGGVVLAVLFVAAAVSANQLLRLALLGLLIGATVTVTVLFLRADEARRTAARFRAEAEREKRRAERVSGFLKEMLASVDPQVSQGRDTSLLVEILESSSRRIDDELGDQPEVAAEIHLILWRTFSGLARLDDAAHHAQLAAELTELDPDSDLWFDAQIALADVHLSRGEKEETQRVLDRCAVRLQTMEPRQYLDFLSISANLRATLGDGAGEEELRRKSVEFARSSSPADSLLLAAQLQWLGRHLVVKGKREEGEPLLLEAIEILSADPGPLRVTYLRTVYALALLWLGSGRADRAEPMVREALGRAIEVYGEEHTESALMTNLLARAVEARGDLSEAERLYRRNVEIVETLLGEGHRLVGSAWNDLAYFHLRVGKLEESAEEYQRAIDNHVAAQGLTHPSTTQSRRNYAAVLLELGEAERAEGILREVLAVPDTRHPNQPFFMEMTHLILGASLVDQGRAGEGRRYLETHLPALEAEFGTSYAAVLAKIGRTRLKRLEQDDPPAGRAR